MNSFLKCFRFKKAIFANVNENNINNSLKIEGNFVFRTCITVLDGLTFMYIKNF